MTSLTGLMQRLIGVIEPFFDLVLVACYFIGIVFIIAAIISAMKISEGHSRDGWGGVTVGFCVGIIFISFPGFMASMSLSLFGTQNEALNLGGAGSAMAYSSRVSAATGMDSAALAGAIYFVQLIGWLSAARGWWIIRAAAKGQSQASTGSGFVHIAAGVICANVTLFVPMLGGSLGISSLGG